MSSVSWLNVGDEAVASRWWNNLLHKRRLPSLDPNLRILKEPVAWFALAAVTSFIIGYFLTPTGIALGVGLLALVALGVLYPYLAVRATKLELRFSDTLCDEGSETLLVVTMRNYCPWPVIGLSIDHLFDLPERENTFRDAAFTLTRFDSVRDGEGSEFEASSRIALPALPGFGRTTLRIRCVSRCEASIRNRTRKSRVASHWRYGQPVAHAHLQDSSPLSRSAFAPARS